MKRSKMLALLLVVAMIATTVLSGCGKKENKPADKLDAEQTLNMIGYDYSSLDPSAESDSESFNTYTHVYEGLMRETSVDGVDTAVLAGASDMKVSKDGLVYTFTLRDSKWSDGQPVKAQDYVFSWKRLIDPDGAHDYMHFIDCVKGVPEFIEKKIPFEEVGIKAKDDKTLEITLAEPIAYFDKMLVFKGLVPQREDIFKALGDQYGVDYTKMVYNGPFVISEYQKGSKIVYKKNEQYWDAKNIKLQTAVCPIVEEPTTLLQMFQAKELDQVGGATPDMLEQLKKMAEGGEVEHITGMLASAFYLVPNCQSPILKNAKVRQALSLAFDRDEYLNVLFKRMVPAYGIVPGGMSVGDKDYRKEVADPFKKFQEEHKDPKAVLNEGLQELGISDPASVKLLYLTGKATTASKTRAEYFQKVIQDKLGIILEIKYSVDSPTYFTERTAGKFDLCYGGWGADFNDVYSMLEYMRTGNGNNNGKYSNPKFDELVNASAKEKDPKKRLDLFKQAEELLVNTDAGIIPLHYQDVQSFRYKYAKGIFIPLFGGYYDLRDAYVSGKQ